MPSSRFRESQVRRIYARFSLGMTVAEIARIEGADRRRVWESIRAD